MKTTRIFTLLALLLAFAVSCNKTDEPNNGGNNNGGLLGDDQVQWVDLGLPSGLLWADRNLGATSPEDYGNYYAWAETSPKSYYDIGNYRYIDIESGAYLTKYCYDTEPFTSGFPDNLTVLESGDDAAIVNLGNGARTPTMNELEELLWSDNTSISWTTLNGVNGIQCTGSNGNTLFLPFAGSSSGDVGSRGYYWSNQLLLYSSPTHANCYFITSDDGIFPKHRQRWDGLPVRAVRSANK